MENSIFSVSEPSNQTYDYIYQFHKQLYEPIYALKGIFNSHLFAPKWCETFIGNIIDVVRNDLQKQISITDNRITNLLEVH